MNMLKVALDWCVAQADVFFGGWWHRGCLLLLVTISAFINQQHTGGQPTKARSPGANGELEPQAGRQTILA